MTTEDEGRTNVKKATENELLTFEDLMLKVGAEGILYLMAQVADRHPHIYKKWKNIGNQRYGRLNG